MNGSKISSSTMPEISTMMLNKRPMSLLKVMSPNPRVVRQGPVNARNP